MYATRTSKHERHAGNGPRGGRRGLFTNPWQLRLAEILAAVLMAGCATAVEAVPGDTTQG